MAGDRHGKHNTTTISFRVNSYEKATIEERVKVSGMKKQDYIVRSCIYNHVCVVGKKETIEIIRSEMKEMSLVLEDVAKDLKSEKPVISEPVLDSMTERYLAFLEAALWMLKGSSYLWEDKKDGIFSSGADTEEFFYRLGLKDGLNLKNTVKSVLEMIS